MSARKKLTSGAILPRVQSSFKLIIHDYANDEFKDKSCGKTSCNHGLNHFEL